MKTFLTTTYTPEQQKQDIEADNSAFLAKHGREMTYEDTIKRFGGYPCGCSQATRNRSNSRSSDDGVLKDTSL